MKRKEELLFLKKKKQKDFCDFAAWGGGNPAPMSQPNPCGANEFSSAGSGTSTPLSLMTGLDSQTIKIEAMN
jgi:hypothetical protein